jgi:GT2 family glycosyltransferase
MDKAITEHEPKTAREWPTVTLVFLVFNRREELRTSLRKMLEESDYPAGRVDVIVVDNASSDGSADMVREEFPVVQVIVRDENVGVSGWNDGFAEARGDYVLALDDDCYLPPDGLRRAVEAAREKQADLVSFKVVSPYDPRRIFTEEYRTGLFMFWGCAILMRREVVETLGGYDPEIFVWANELEFTIRFFDHGFRHLHLPEVAAQHMKETITDPTIPFNWRTYIINAKHWGYIAAKLFTPRDAAEALVALVARYIRDGFNGRPPVWKAVRATFEGFFHGLRHRDPVQHAEVSRFYRHNFESFASPWWLSRPLPELIRAFPREVLRDGAVRDSRPEGIGRVEAYYEARERYYPNEAAVLEFSGGAARTGAS